MEAIDKQNPFLFHKDDFDDGCNFLHQRRKYGYKVLNEISRGAYGVVYRARDNKNDEIVAMKQEFHGLCQSTMIEIHILKSLPRHPSIVEFKRVVEDKATNSIFVVMEYLEYDLKRYMRVWKEPFTLREIKHVTKQLLEGVAFLHEKCVMHRDLKPDNILMNNKKEKLKICDFGLAAPFGAPDYSPSVGTRWYKAPELLLGSRNYSSAVDMWAVGCIMAELVLKKVLFRGKSDDHQLPCIYEVIGPSYNHIRLKMATETSFSGATWLTRSGLDLLERLLEYNPKKRITARDALSHAWFREV